ncbi:hypothetical protein [Spirosoma agri]|uniref:Uncharacterized protein n=1 Tax=Spirosoma agri TaxID=1987381 RepID=A0A6M0INY8_9BACT|nr:hypothetical protein [Spirosoma agri]NEU69642.1 hypothetical protein [Spirosoma agri]
MKLESASFDELTVFHELTRFSPAQAPPQHSSQPGLLPVFQRSVSPVSNRTSK